MVYASGFGGFSIGVLVGLWLAVVTFRTVFRAARESQARKAG